MTVDPTPIPNVPNPPPMPWLPPWLTEQPGREEQRSRHDDSEPHGATERVSWPRIFPGL